VRRVGVAAAAIALILIGIPTAGPTTASDFINGNSFASAVVVKVAPGVGGLGLATTSGVAVSEIKNQLAQSQAQTADLGLIGTTLTAESCSGAPGALTPDQLPAPTRVDNRKGDASGTSDEVPLAGSTLGAGREFARATKQPLAEAVATMVSSVTDPLLRISGGEATAATRIVDGKAREATSSVDANVDIAGAVQLRGLRWDAVHRTGANPDVHGTFSIDGATAGGLPLPVGTDSLKPLQDALNGALKQTGIRVELPTVIHIKEPADVIRVTPLRVIMQDSPLGATLLRPILELTRAQKEQLFTELGSSVCQLAGALLVGDISLSIMAGTGFLAIDIGGVEATTAEVIYTNPFGTDLPLPNLGLPAVPELPLEPSVLPIQTGSAAPRPVVAAGPVERVCESTHRFHWPSCSNGAAAALGGLGLLATAGVALLDWRHQRRRLSKAEVTA